MPTDDFAMPFCDSRTLRGKKRGFPFFIWARPSGAKSVRVQCRPGTFFQFIGQGPDATSDAVDGILRWSDLTNSGSFQNHSVNGPSVAAQSL